VAAYATRGDRVTRYVAAPAASVRLVPLDALTLAYHRPSGITHVLASPAPELVAALAEPADLDTLLARLAADYDLPDADVTALEERLTELEAAGLVLRA
jgi:PqqD family protein of HPr-rel-A system